MKTLLLFALLATASTGGYAQTAPAKAPARKPVKKAAQSPPTSTNKLLPSSTSSPARTTTPTRTAASPSPSSPSTSPARPNSSALPAPVPVAAPSPAPVVTQQRTNTGRSRGRSVSSGGLGFHEGDKLLNIGVGLSSYYYGHPIGLSYEVGITEDISVGGQLDYNSGSYDDYYGYNYRYRYSAYYLGARGSYHFNRVLNINENKIDLYAGLGLGYRSFKWNDSYYGSGYGYSYGSGLFLNYFIGGKYYFTNKVGAFLELGYTGLSSSRVGLAVKF
jgi:hypothetical protein